MSKFEDDFKILAQAKIDEKIEMENFFDESYHSEIVHLVQYYIKNIRNYVNEDDIVDLSKGKAVFAYHNQNKVSQDLVVNKTVVWSIIICYVDKINFEEELSSSIEKSPLLAKFPVLKGKYDNHDLFPSTLFKKKESWSIDVEFDNHIISMSSRIPRDLNRYFVKMMRENKNGDLKIKLSSSKFCLKKDYTEPLLEAIEAGPPFKKDKVFQKLKEGTFDINLTRHDYTEMQLNVVMMSFNNIQRVEVHRSQKQDGYVSYLVEELPQITKQDEFVGYVKTTIFHSDFKLSDKAAKFKHADSTVLIYTIDDYKERLLGLEKVKAIGHIKLYRVDNCDIDMWIDLFNLSFPRNELIYEYLNNEKHPILRRFEDD